MKRMDIRKTPSPLHDTKVMQEGEDTVSFTTYLLFQEALNSLPGQVGNMRASTLVQVTVLTLKHRTGSESHPHLLPEGLH